MMNKQILIIRINNSCQYFYYEEQWVDVPNPLFLFPLKIKLNLSFRN